MSTITLPNIRVSSDLTVRVRLKDGGVAIDWSTLTGVKAYLYADEQRSIASRCAVSVDEEDSTLLVCQYAASKPQYLGVNRIIVCATYMGETKNYDKPALNFVRWTADQEGEQITIDDPDVDVEIEVSDVSSSILDEAIRAAITAAEEAVDAKCQVLETEAEVEAAEALRVSAEESRVEAEEGRAEAEAARVDEEAVRVSAEDARVVAENARAAAEDLREGAEDDRAAAETARETAEAARVAAEALRVSAEGSRETAEAAREAQASADHTVAAGDHTQAAADHTQAAADHTTAASDHTQAGADHTLAAADHVTAGEDHAQAQDDHEVMAGYDTRLGNVEGEVSQLEAKVTNFLLGKKYTQTGGLTDLANGMAAKIPVTAGRVYVFKGLFTTGLNPVVYTDPYGVVVDYFGTNIYEYAQKTPAGSAFALVTFNAANYYSIIVYELITGDIIWSPKDDRGTREEIEYFDIKNYTESLYPNSSSWANNNAYFALRGMIPVSPGDTVKWDKTLVAGAVQFYKSDGTLIDYWGAAGRSSIVAPAESAYFWIGFNDSNFRDAKVIVNDVVVWVPDGVTTLPEMEERISVLEKKSNFENGVKLSSSGTLQVDQDAVLMNVFIPCKNGDIFTVIKGKGSFVVFDGQKSRLDNWGVDSDEVAEKRTIEITDCPTAAYCRVAFQSAYLDVACLKDANGKVVWCANIEDQSNYASHLICGSSIDEYDWQGIVPDFYDEYIKQKADAVSVLDSMYGQNGDSFIFLTDPHIETNYNHSYPLVKYIYEHTAVKRFLCGGDIVASPSTLELYIKRMQRWMSQYRFLPVYITRGNHDYIADNSVGYGLLFKPIERYVNTSRQMYYCFDNESQKVRYIVLDTPWPTDETTRTDFDYDSQLSWLAGKITEKDDSWRVLIMQHILFSDHTEDGEGNIISATRADVCTRLVSALGNISGGAKVLGVISGHTHWDWVEYGGGVPLIATTCDASYNQNDVPWTDARGKGTIMEQAFDVVHLDFAGNRFIMTRIGFGPNRIVNIAQNDVAVNGTIALSPSITGTITWWVGDNSIASVSSGTVSGVSSGTTFVRARNDGGDEEYFQIVVS